MKKKISNFWVALAVCIPLAIMIAISSYSVTLYRLFCSATGANGTTRRATSAPDERGRFITVLFDTTVSPALPWRFVPLQRRVRLRLGEEPLA